MIKETIRAVEDAEAKASELVAQASEDARRVKAEAEAEADRMLADAQKRGERSRDSYQLAPFQGWKGGEQ